MNFLRLRAFAAASSLILSALVSVQSQNGDSKPAYMPTGEEVTLTGSIDFTGKSPGPRMIDSSADPVCFEGFPGLSTDWLMVENGRLANVVVYVANGSLLDSFSWKPPDSAAVLEHIGCRYQPHVLGVQIGQTLRILNSDATHHNTHPTPKINVEWNQSQPPGGEPIVKTFARPEVAIPFKDNQHPWEKAYVAVFSHPYFAITDANGDFKIERLPPGHYELVAWHEEMVEKRMSLTVVPGESKAVKFTFDRSDIKPHSRLLSY